MGKLSALNGFWQQLHVLQNPLTQFLQNCFWQGPTHFNSSQLSQQHCEHSSSQSLFFMQYFAIIKNKQLQSVAQITLLSRIEVKDSPSISYPLRTRSPLLNLSQGFSQFFGRAGRLLISLEQYSKQIQLMRRRSYQIEALSAPKYKYSFNDKTYDLSVGSSFDSRIGAYRAKQNTVIVEEKIKSTNNFTLEKLLGKSKIDNQLGKPHSKSVKYELKLPVLKKKELDNPQAKHAATIINPNGNYYLSRIAKSCDIKENGYLIALARQHFQQTIEALKIGKGIKPSAPRQIKLIKKNPKLKTVYLDLDETLVHCDEMSNNYTVKLDFPVEGGSIISAGIRVRPHCNDFLKELASIAEIIIFTASSASYADVVLDYLDPHKKYFAHRLYRQHCTLEKGFYTKDLRSVNRRLEDSVLVDNSGFSFMLQPENGIPILPYYHFNKDRQLLSLLDFLKQIVKFDDMREKIKSYFFWQKYLSSEGDPKKIFMQNYSKQQK